MRGLLDRLRQWWQGRLERRRLAGLGPCMSHRERYHRLEPPRE